MKKGASSGLHGELDPQKKQKILSKLANYGCNKSTLAALLQDLDRQGVLHSGLFHNDDRRVIRQATESHGKVRTPYGTVVQQMKIDTPSMTYWDYIHPLALMWYLASICVEFARLMHNTIADRVDPLKIIIYIDEACPGNPLRPEKSRTLQNIYWCIAEWPDFVLQRMECWPCFGSIRTTIANEIPGDVSALMTQVLRVFFCSTQSFATGVTIVYKGIPKLVTGIFGGFVADERALKEIFSVKGSGGNRPCQSCSNVTRNYKSTIAVDDSLTIVDISCTDPSKFMPFTKDLFYACADRLMEAKGTLKTTPFDQLQTDLGITFDPDALIYATDLRPMLDPIGHYIRDWMHTIASQGIGVTELAGVLNEVRRNGFLLDDVLEYATLFTLPRSKGKVDPIWFSPSRLTETTLKGFAGEKITMIYLIVAFLQDVVVPTGVMQKHAACLEMLSKIVDILLKGPEGALRYMPQLTSLIELHGELFVELGYSVKPKFHQLFHIVDGMRSVNRLFSCWVTERKHRTVKRVALHAFRNIEHSVTYDLVNHMVNTIVDDCLYRESYLLHPKALCVNGEQISVSKGAQLRVGEVWKDDIVYLTTKQLGKVLGFFEKGGDIVCHLEMYRASPIASTWEVRSDSRAFFDVGYIMDAVYWRDSSNGMIRIISPTHM